MKVLDLQALPEGCIANIISFTTPKDACRLSSVSKTFRSAAECDTVWDKFLPPGVQTIFSSSVSSSSSVFWFKSKKELYLSFCDDPVSTGEISFSLDKGSGKNCYMISARALQILGSATPYFWRWISLPDTRCEEVAELVDFLWLEITWKIVTSWILSPSTLYKAYLVFKLTEQAYGFRGQPVKVKVKKSYKLSPTTVGIEASEQLVVLDREKKRPYWQCILGTHAWQPQEIDEASYPKERADGWSEIVLGEFSYEREEELLMMSCEENSSGAFKGGLIVQGIEIRPYFGERPDPRQNWGSSWARSWNRAQSYSNWVLYFLSLGYLFWAWV